MEKLTVTQKIIIGVILGFLAGLLIGNMSGRSDEEQEVDTQSVSEEQTGTENTDPGDEEISENEETSEENSEDDQTQTAPDATLATTFSDRIAAEDQMAGDTVRIASLELEDTAWVVVYEDRNGGFGNILGARRFQPGDHTDVTVRLLRGTVAGERYYAVLHDDSGGPRFDRNADLMILVDGKEIMTTFNTTRVDAN